MLHLEWATVEKWNHAELAIGHISLHIARDGEGIHNYMRLKRNHMLAIEVLKQLGSAKVGIELYKILSKSIENKPK
jgi:hypothetical protein